MLIAAERTIEAIAFVVQAVPIGTNVGLLRILWVMVNGSFLQSRGAVLAALHVSGFDVGEMRRSWAALSYGAWDVNELLEQWQMYVESQNQWRARRYERYRVLSVDITGFWRPHLKGWLGKHYHHLAQKALPAVVVGVMIISGQVGSPLGAQRIPLLRRLVRCQPHASKPDFRVQLLRQAAAQAAIDQVIVVDAEFGIAAPRGHPTGGWRISLCGAFSDQRHRPSQSTACLQRQRALSKVWGKSVSGAPWARA